MSDNQNWAWVLVACANGILNGVKQELADMHGKASMRCYRGVRHAQHLLDEAIARDYGMSINRDPDKDGDE